VELTPKKFVVAGNAPANLMCIVTQHELFQMRATIESCHAVFHQIAGQQGHSTAHFDLADGKRVVVPTQTAIAMAALTHIFGVEWNAVQPPADEMSVEIPEEPVPEAPQETAPPPRAAWKPTLVQGGKNG
jgi:hypothetical protein